MHISVYLQMNKHDAKRLLGYCEADSASGHEQSRPAMSEVWQGVGSSFTFIRLRIWISHLFELLFQESMMKLHVWSLNLGGLWSHCSSMMDVCFSFCLVMFHQRTIITDNLQEDTNMFFSTASRPTLRHRKVLFCEFDFAIRVRMMMLKMSNLPASCLWWIGDAVCLSPKCFTWRKITWLKLWQATLTFDEIPTFKSLKQKQGAREWRRYGTSE